MFSGYPTEAASMGKRDPSSLEHGQSLRRIQRCGFDPSRMSVTLTARLTWHLSRAPRSMEAPMERHGGFAANEEAVRGSLGMVAALDAHQRKKLDRRQAQIRSHVPLGISMLRQKSCAMTCDMDVEDTQRLLSHTSRCSRDS